jgi:hypothetical protein
VAEKVEEVRVCRWVKKPARGTGAVLAIGDVAYTLLPLAGPDKAQTDGVFADAWGWQVINQESGAIYVLTNRIAPTCTCPDYTHRRAGMGESCKHGLSLRAAILRLRRREKPAPEGRA